MSASNFTNISEWTFLFNSTFSLFSTFDSQVSLVTNQEQDLSLSSTPSSYGNTSTDLPEATTSSSSSNNNNLYPTPFDSICFDWYFVLIPSFFSSFLFSFFYVVWTVLDTQLRSDQLFLKLFKSKAFLTPAVKKNQSQPQSLKLTFSDSVEDPEDSLDAPNAPEVELSDLILHYRGRNKSHSTHTRTSTKNHSQRHRSNSNKSDSSVQVDYTINRHENNGSKLMQSIIDTELLHARVLRKGGHSVEDLFDPLRHDFRAQQRTRRVLNRSDSVFIKDFFEVEDAARLETSFRGVMQPLLITYFGYDRKDVDDVINVILSYLPRIQVLYFGYVMEMQTNNWTVKCTRWMFNVTAWIVCMQFLCKVTEIWMFATNAESLNVTMLLLWSEWKASRHAWIWFWMAQYEDRMGRYKSYVVSPQVALFTVSILEIVVILLLLGPLLFLWADLLLTSMFSQSGAIVLFGTGFLLLILACGFCCCSVASVTWMIKQLFDEGEQLSTTSLSLCDGCARFHTRNEGTYASYLGQIATLGFVLILSDLMVYAFVSNVVFGVIYFSDNEQELAEDDQWIGGTTDIISYSMLGKYCDNSWYEPFFNLGVLWRDLDYESILLVLMWWI